MNINDITNDKLISKPNTKEFRDNYDAIFNAEPSIHNYVIGVPVELLGQYNDFKRN